MPPERRVHRDDPALEQLVAGVGAVVERQKLLERPELFFDLRHPAPPEATS
jgi:hypothetical protein